MRIACCGDLHIRDTIPVNRIDDFTETLFNKLDFIFNHCIDNYIQTILFPGDVFNSPIQPYHTLIRTLERFHGNEYFKMYILACYGQHDLLFHNKNNREVALNVIESGKALTILDNVVTIDGINFYGCHYGDDIPEIKTEGINILIMHKMVIDKNKLWDKQEVYSQSSHLLRKHKYNLIVCGDNHNLFTNNYRTRFLVNAGSLMRTRIDQYNHKPCFFIYDTDEKTLERIEIPIKPFVEVFKEQEDKKEVIEFDDQFTTQFENQEDISVNFKKNIMSNMNKLNEEQLSTGAREIINKLFGGIS